jgi:acetyl-CoA acetyltransferase
LLHSRVPVTDAAACAAPAHQRPRNPRAIAVPLAVGGWRMVDPAMDPEHTIAMGEGGGGSRRPVRDRRDEQDTFALASHRKATAAR